MKRVLIFTTAVALSGCDFVPLDMLKPKPTSPSGSASNAVPASDADLPATPPVVHPDIPIGDPSADPTVTASGSLGKTIVSLGTATEPGSWLKTPLVTVTRPGRVTWKGKCVAVTLIPIEGASGAGSRMSLQAMQLIGLPLTELTEVEVIAQ